MCTNVRAVSFLQVLIRLLEPSCWVAICSLSPPSETATKLPTQRGPRRWFALRWYAHNGFEARHLRRRRPCGRGAHVAAHASEARGASALSCRPLHVHRMCMHTACARGICALHARPPYMRRKCPVGDGGPNMHARQPSSTWMLRPPWLQDTPRCQTSGPGRPPRWLLARAMRLAARGSLWMSAWLLVARA